MIILGSNGNLSARNLTRIKGKHNILQQPISTKVSENITRENLYKIKINEIITKVWEVAYLTENLNPKELSGRLKSPTTVPETC